MGWLIALAVLVLLGCLPVGVSAIYDAPGPLVRLIAGPIRITLFPAKKKDKPKKEKKTKEKKSVAIKSDAPQQPQEKKGGSLTDFLPLVKVATDFLGDFRRKLRVNMLELKLNMAGGDPCDLAINYGRAWAAVGNIVPQLERLFVIKKRDVQVDCDFVGDRTTIYLRLDITITLGRILSLGIRYGFRALKEFIKIINKRKGGAVK